MTDILIGYGEVGQALYETLSERRSVSIHDPPKGHVVVGKYAFEWMHVAFYTPGGIPNFIEAVSDYVRQYEPGRILIHSTVPVGTCAAIQTLTEHPVVYSPIRGIHPHLARYLREFPKWVACSSEDDLQAAEALLHAAGMQTRRAPTTQCLEWMKLVETTEYGYRIALWQEFEREAKVVPGADLTALKEWLFEKRKVYDGDRGLAPVMHGGFIGGHCVVPNWKLLSPLMTQQLYTWLMTSNELRREGR